MTEQAILAVAAALDRIADAIEENARNRDERIAHLVAELGPAFHEPEPVRRLQPVEED